MADSKSRIAAVILSLIFRDRRFSVLEVLKRKMVEDIAVIATGPQDEARRTGDGAGADDFAGNHSQRSLRRRVLRPSMGRRLGNGHSGQDRYYFGRIKYMKRQMTPGKNITGVLPMVCKA